MRFTAVFALIALLVAALRVTGCAARVASLGECAVMGAAMGGAGGAAGSTAIDEDWTGAGAAIGAVSGAALGWLICAAIPEKEIPEPPPEPEPVTRSTPPPPPPPPAPRERIVLRGVNFGFDSATLGEGPQVVIEVVAETLLRNPEVEVRVEGHTDATGPAEYNLALSRRRAEAVRDALVEGGVEASRLSVAALGEEQPIASNDTAEGRAINRRVQLVNLD